MANRRTLVATIRRVELVCHVPGRAPVLIGLLRDLATFEAGLDCFSGARMQENWA